MSPHQRVLSAGVPQGLSPQRGVDQRGAVAALRLLVRRLDPGGQPDVLPGPVRGPALARCDWTDYLAVRADVLRPSTGAGEESTGALDEDTPPAGHGAMRAARLVGMFN